MIQISKNDIKEALKLIDEGTPEPVGYRVMAKPLKTREGLEGVEMSEFQNLAKSGFVAQTDTEKERKDKGTFYSIALDVGNMAYKTELLGGSPWIEPGNVIIHERYAGVEVEWPPGSGEKIRFMNDESVMGRMGA